MKTRQVDSTAHLNTDEMPSGYRAVFPPLTLETCQAAGAAAVYSTVESGKGRNACPQVFLSVLKPEKNVSIM